MGLFSTSNTCFQCHKGFSDSNRFCPHCGAQIVEQGGQVFMRRVRRGAFSLILGALLGVGGVLVLAKFFPDWSEKIRFPILPEERAVEIVGLTLGGAVGVFIYMLQEYARDS